MTDPEVIEAAMPLVALAVVLVASFAAYGFGLQRDGPALSAKVVEVQVIPPQIDDPHKRDRGGRISVGDVVRWRMELRQCTPSNPAIQSGAYAEMRPHLIHANSQWVDSVEGNVQAVPRRRAGSSSGRDTFADALLGILGGWEQSIREGWTLFAHPPLAHGEALPVQVSVQDGTTRLTFTNYREGAQFSGYLRLVDPHGYFANVRRWWRKSYPVHWQKSGSGTTTILAMHTDSICIAKGTMSDEGVSLKFFYQTNNLNENTSALVCSLARTGFEVDGVHSKQWHFKEILKLLGHTIPEDHAP